MIFVILLAIGLLGLMYWLLMGEKSQVFGHTNWRGPSKPLRIALTFDDGPNEPYTTQLLAVLKKHNVLATFFVVGKSVEHNPSVLRAIDTAGHTVGNHSYNHKFINYIRQPSFDREIRSTNQLIYGIIGKRPALYRSPWLVRYPRLLKQVKRLGMIPVFGIFCAESEVLQPTAEKLVKRAMSRVKPGTIMIFHDGYNGVGADRSQTIAAVDTIIPILKKRGYELVTADVLLGVNAYIKD